MNLSSFSKKELDVLEAVFGSFDQGDVGYDLADADGDIYEQMRDQILDCNGDSAKQKLADEAATSFPIKVRFQDGEETSFQTPQDLPSGKPFVVIGINVDC
jgi:hypothetical protein